MVNYEDNAAHRRQHRLLRGAFLLRLAGKNNVGRVALLQAVTSDKTLCGGFPTHDTVAGRT